MLKRERWTDDRLSQSLKMVNKVEVDGPNSLPTAEHPFILHR